MYVHAQVELFYIEQFGVGRKVERRGGCGRWQPVSALSSRFSCGRLGFGAGAPDFPGEAGPHADIEQGPHRPALGVGAAEAGAVADVLADQDAAVRGQAHGHAGEGVGRGQAPVVLAAQRRALCVRQPPARAGVRGEDQQPAAVVAELPGEAVRGQDRLGREGAALRRGQADAVVVRQRGDRRALVEAARASPVRLGRGVRGGRMRLQPLAESSAGRMPIRVMATACGRSRSELRASPSVFRRIKPRDGGRGGRGGAAQGPPAPAGNGRRERTSVAGSVR